MRAAYFVFFVNKIKTATAINPSLFLSATKFLNNLKFLFYRINRSDETCFLYRAAPKVLTFGAALFNFVLLCLTLFNFTPQF